MTGLFKLREERRAREVALAESQGLNLAHITTWSADEIAPIEAELLECTTGYAELAEFLQSALEEMAAAALADWFDEIGWDAVGSRMSERITDYMERG